MTLFRLVDIHTVRRETFNPAWDEEGEPLRSFSYYWEAERFAKWMRNRKGIKCYITTTRG